MSAASSRSDCPFGDGEAATGSINRMVAPKLPSAPLIAWAKRWISTGCSRPTWTSAWPRCCCRSCAAASSQAALAPGACFQSCGPAPSAAARWRSAAVNLSRAQRQPMIGLGADQGRRAFDRIDPAHLGPGLVRAPPRGEVAGIGEPARHRRDQIAFDREDHIGGVEIEHLVERPPKGALAGGEFGVAVQRLPLVPAHRRELLLQCSDLRGERGRRHGPGQKSQPVAAARRQLRAAADQGRDKILPVGDFPMADDCLGATRVVELEDARLHDRTGGAEARRVVGIALDLDRPRHLVRDQHAGGISLDGHRRRIIARAAGHHAGRLLDIRQKLAPLDLLVAGREPAERDRSRHQLQKAAPLQGAEHGAEPWHLALDDRSEARRLGQFLEAAPIVPAGPVHRWHTEQSSKVCGWMW